jgi:ribosome maturation factor RimP
MNLEESIKNIVQDNELKLYDIVTTRENNNNIFRVYVTSDDGVNLDKCGKISSLISPLLDVHNPLNGKYNLEVSSPGIERKLTKLIHFESSIGCNIKGKEYSTEKFKGKFLSFKDNILTIQEEDSKDTFTIKYDDILSASTFYNWKK